MSEYYNLSALAEQQIEAILAFTEDKFGTYQADAYAVGISKTFDLLAQFPDIGSDAAHIKSNWLKFRFQSHYIFYTQNEYRSGILIEAVIHECRNVRSDVIEN